MITDQSSLEEWRQRANRQPQGRTVLDLEADSMHRHREKLCLIQYGDADGVCLIDPLAIENMRLFSDWIQETEIWMHGADYDMSLLQNAYGCLPRMILDTQIAARLLGFLQFGLAALVEHHFGVVLSKKNQKADWGKRPIPPDMQEYAQGDVKYMLSMADQLVDKLKQKGRYEWFLEYCAFNLEKGRQRHDVVAQDSWRIKGSGKFNRRGLAALKVLWHWRDKEAADWDRPAFMVCSNDCLLRWAQSLQEFRTVQGNRSFHTHRQERFLRAVREFQLMDEEDYPKRIRHEKHDVDEKFDSYFNHWSIKRNNIAEQLAIEPAIIASRSQLEHIAHDEDAGLAQLMNWQRSLLLD